MSESSGEETVAVDLPSDLHDWLAAQAAEVDTEPAHLLVDLLAAYQTTVADESEVEQQLDARVDEQVEAARAGEVDDEFVEQVATEVRAELQAELDTQIDGTVKSILAETLDEQVQATVADRVDGLVTERVNESTSSVQRQLGNRIETAESEFQEKLDDVRNRVIQVKKETDRKAPADHTHEEFDDVAALTEQVEQVETELRELRATVGEDLPEHEKRLDEIETTLSEVEDRLQTVAWVTSDLRESIESGGGLAAVERIKRAAAKADVSSAKCENCSNSVNLALLTDPECPHCSATVNNIDPNPGWFRSPRLTVASQLESGEHDE